MTWPKKNPKELARILSSSNSDVYSLTMGAEILGSEVKDEDIVVPVFRRLLKHINAVVREGSMIGISAFYVDKKPPQDILTHLLKMSTDDPSPVCKNFALTLISDYK